MTQLFVATLVNAFVFELMNDEYAKIKVGQLP